jgi:hypothetical protein
MELGSERDNQTPVKVTNTKGTLEIKNLSDFQAKLFFENI